MSLFLEIKSAGEKTWRAKAYGLLGCCRPKKSNRRDTTKESTSVPNFSHGKGLPHLPAHHNEKGAIEPQCIGCLQGTSGSLGQARSIPRVAPTLNGGCPRMEFRFLIPLLNGGGAFQAWHQATPWVVLGQGSQLFCGGGWVFLQHRSDRVSLKRYPCPVDPQFDNIPASTLVCFLKVKSNVSNRMQCWIRIHIPDIFQLQPVWRWHSYSDEPRTGGMQNNRAIKVNRNAIRHHIGSLSPSTSAQWEAAINPARTKRSECHPTIPPRQLKSEGKKF